MSVQKRTKPRKTGSKSRSGEIAIPSDKEPPKVEKRRETTIERTAFDFPIVGIGASAGGLEALDELFDNMPASTGMAFVVVTHQHPGHTSMLPELLRRKTEMSVIEASEGTKLQPNYVYVGPPGGQMAILDGTLHRMETERKEPPRLPIDYF